MKERKGPFGQMVGGIVDSVVQTARRRAQDREPRVLLYDAAGRPRTVPPGAPGRDSVVEAAGKLIELVGMTADEEAAAAEAGAADPAAEAETEAEAREAGAGEHPGEAHP